MPNYARFDQRRRSLRRSELRQLASCSTSAAGTDLQCPTMPGSTSVADRSADRSSGRLHPAQPAPQALISNAQLCPVRPASPIAPPIGAPAACILLNQRRRHLSPVPNHARFDRRSGRPPSADQSPAASALTTNNQQPTTNNQQLPLIHHRLHERLHRRLGGLHRDLVAERVERLRDADAQRCEPHLAKVLAE